MSDRKSSQFNQSLAMATQEETEKFLAILKRTLSGTLGKNLMDITFETQQVAYGEEHKLLMALRDSVLKDEDAVQAFFQKVTQSLVIEGSYMILLAHDAYDVPYRSKDGEQQDDAGSEVFSYFLCGICPVKETKPALSYHVHENQFYNLHTDYIVTPPALGFLFPAFDERSANIYNALYYSKDIAENHKEFADAIFNRDIPMPAAAQKQTFQNILQDSLAEECCPETVQAVHGLLCEMIALHKESKVPEPLALSKGAVKSVLKSCGAKAEQADIFEGKYADNFGEEACLCPHNVINTKQIEICTPDVTVHVSADRGDLVETHVIDGRKYILIRADEDVEVNGVRVQIS